MRHLGPVDLGVCTAVFHGGPRKPVTFIQGPQVPGIIANKAVCM